jgi:hypothetical protein
MLVYFISIWYILQPVIGIFSDYLVYFPPFWYVAARKIWQACNSSGHPVQLRENREREVRVLRQLISNKKTTITTVTKGIPFTKLEVRPAEQQPNYSGPTEAMNPLLSGMPNATAMARGNLNETSPLFGSSSTFNLPGVGGP